MMVSIQIKKPNGGWGYKAESRKPICRKMATAFQSSSRVGGGLGHLLECLFFFPPSLISPERSEDGSCSAAQRSKAESVTNQRLCNSSQSSLMNAF